MNIKFTDKYIMIAESIKKLLKLDYYSCVHLRLEDDAINFMINNNDKLTFEYVNKYYKMKYIDFLDLLKKHKSKIYICTSLGLNNNLNNDYYKELKEKYNLIDKNNIITSTEDNCREIYAIIDFIIAQDSNFFLGCDWSSFSLYIYNSHKINSKNSHLLNLWDVTNHMK